MSLDLNWLVGTDQYERNRLIKLLHAVVMLVLL